MTTSKETKKTIRVGIGGQGRSGYGIHTNTLAELPDHFRITAIADELPERCIEAQSRSNATCYPDYRPLLAAGGFDLFVNALPTPLHVPATIEALERGYHVVCEKPMAPNVKDFDAMTDAAKKAGRQLFPFQNNRLQPFFMKMQEVIASGKLGRIIHVRSHWGGFRRRWDWQTIQANMGGSLFNTGPHAVDQAIMLFGPERKPEVFCRMDCNNPFSGDADDLCSLTLYDPAREAPLIEILISAYVAHPFERMYTICGTQGGLSGGPEHLHWRYFDPKAAPRQEMWPLWSEDRKYPSEELPWIEEEWTIDDELTQGTSGYTLTSFRCGPRGIYTNVYDVLQHAAEPVITLSQARRQIEILEEAHRQNPLPRTGSRQMRR